MTRTLVLLHGFGTGPASWGETFPALLRSHSTTLILPTAPGHDHEPLADPIATAAAQLPAGAVIGGWSMGGYTALRVALAHPDRVTGLVLLATGAGGATAHDMAAFAARAHGYAHTLEAQGTQAFAEELYSQPRFDGLTDDCRTRLVQASTRSDAQALAHVARGPLGSRTPVHQLTGQYPGRALVIHGANDPGSAPSDALLRLLPNAEIITLTGTGHAMHLEDPQTLAQAIANFVHST